MLQKPYDIGDRIHISSPNQENDRDGSAGWFVDKVDLYSTTVRFATTNEVATYSNGSLASQKVINGARSPNAIVYIRMKFGIDVEFSAVDVFQKSVESFVKARNREWLVLLAIRVTRIEADLGFVEYTIVLQHTASWQDVGMILQSKAALSRYCLEVAKKLEMRYEAPPLPVSLEISKPDAVKAAVLDSAPDESHFGAGDGDVV